MAGAGAAFVVCWLAATAVAAEPAAPWTVKDARIRATVQLQEAPLNPDAGVEIKVPDFGLVRPGGGDYALTDAAGKPVPVSVSWQAQGHNTLLLARDLQAGQSYYLYIGGAPGTAWTPKTSVLLETRSALGARSEAFTSFGALQAAWNGAAPQTQGAAFVEKIFAGENAFGENTNFYSHYRAYLAPMAGDTELFTDSTNASFVLVNDQLFVAWTGPPNENRRAKDLLAKRLPASKEPIKLDYYQAKGSGAEPPTAALGWRKPGGALEIVPENAFLHPGDTRIERYEARDGAPVPAPIITFKSYLGYGGAYLYEVQGKLGPADLQGATVEWRFGDGAVCPGREFDRIMSGVPGTQEVTVTARRGAAAMQVVRRIGFYGKPPKEASDGEEEGKHGERGHEHYLQLLLQLDPTKLDATMLAGALPLLFDVGTDAQIAGFANAWLALQPDASSPLWLPAYSARIRNIAQTNPQAALAELSANQTGRQLYGEQLNRLELELRVFAVHDLATMPRVQQLAFNLGTATTNKLGDIRVGDLYRLNGNLVQAAARYQAAQPADQSAGRQLPAQDQANAMTVEDLLNNGTRDQAQERLSEWELAHPMAKLTTNFLVLRARVLALYGRWREALTELETPPLNEADSPYEIDVTYYRARCLYELGRKDEARKLWQDLAKKYPKSELAGPSLEWANKA